MKIRAYAALLCAAVGLASVTVVPAAQAAEGLDVDQAAPVTSDALENARAGVLRLEAYETKVRYMPEVGKWHNYRLSMSPAFWSVVALWSPTDGDMDLELYADKKYKRSLGRSAFGSGMIDFVAVDRSLMTASNYFPRARTYSGTSAYSIEFAQGLDLLQSSPKDFYMLPEDLVRVYDTYLAAGTTYTITLDPSSSFGDGDLFLVGSTPGDPASGVQRRIDALKVSAAQGEGGTETITFTPSVSDTYGVVVLQANGSGSYILSRTHN